MTLGMSEGTSGEVVVTNYDDRTRIKSVGDEKGQKGLFPEERADGPLSGVFQAARRFRDQLDSEE